MPIQPPSAPAAPSPPSTGRFVTSVDNTSPAAVYRAADAARSELVEQLNQLQSQRREIAEQLQEDGSAATKSGLEQRLADVDKRIATTDKAIAEANARVAATAGIPGAVVPHVDPIRNGPPDEAFVLGGMLIVFVMFPMAIAFTRRLWKRTTSTVAALPQEILDRFARLDHAVDSIAVEVERIGEGQRFVTRVLAEGNRGAVGAGAAQPVDVGRDRVAARPSDGEQR
ncbi:MAG: hypothetical protein H0W68_06165 [Gemmatimonadaceae bacterium]|nr:hypothetical protein [Gemmatimonadaceae bacterium]